MRLLRSTLTTPGSNEKMFEKASKSGADVALLDLEDSVAPDSKETARIKVVTALTTLDWGRSARAIRMNAIDTQWAADDLIEVVSGTHGSLDLVVVPKVKTAQEIWWVDVLLSQLEQKLKLPKRIALHALIEDAAGLVNAAEIAKASTRLQALVLGLGDLSASLQMQVNEHLAPIGGYPGDVWHFARCTVVSAARAAEVDAIDSAFPDYNDSREFSHQCQLARVLGFNGKWVIHPNQLPLAHKIFSPSRQDAERARRLCDAYEEAHKHGLGAISVDGMLVDAASIRISRNILEVYERSQEVNG